MGCTFFARRYPSRKCPSSIVEAELIVGGAKSATYMLSRRFLAIGFLENPLFVQLSTQVRDLSMKIFQGNQPFTHPSHNH